MESWASSSVGSSSEIRSAFMSTTNGSRFWALADDDSDESSGEESSAAAVPSVVGETQSDLSRSPRSGSNVAQVKDVVAPPVMPVPRYTTKVEKALNVHPKSMQGRTVQTKKLQRHPGSCKPWKGPLPPPRCTSTRSLGDLWVADSRAGGEEAAVNLRDWCQKYSPSMPVGSPASGKKGPRRDLNSKFKNLLIPVGLDGPPLRAGMGRGLVGRMFRGLGGIGFLLSRGGKPSGSRSIPPPVQQSHDAPAVPATQGPSACSSACSSEVTPAGGSSIAAQARRSPGSQSVMAAGPWDDQGFRYREGRGHGRQVQGVGERMPEREEVDRREERRGGHTSQ